MPENGGYSQGDTLAAAQKLIHILVGVETVVPRAERVVFNKVEFTHLCLGNPDSCVVIAWSQIGGNGETGVGLGCTDEIEHGVDVGERLASPVSADLAEQAVFDRVPLGSAGRVMTHGHGEAEAVANPILEIFFPSAATPAVASASIRQDQDLMSLRVSLPSLA